MSQKGNIWQKDKSAGFCSICVLKGSNPSFGKSTAKESLTEAGAIPNGGLMGNENDLFIFSALIMSGNLSLGGARNQLSMNDA